MWSKISMGLNILLVIAVGYLFYKTSGSGKAQSTGEVVEANVSSAFSDTSAYETPVVAYVNGDSIMSKYTYFIEMRKQLESSMGKSQSKIEAQMKKAKDEYDELMNYANSKGDALPPAEQETISNRIMELEYDIKNLQAKEEDDLMRKEAKLNEDLMARIHDFVHTYAMEKNIDMVFNYQEVMQVILFGNPAFDITPDVISGLNESYEKEKAELTK
jgi:outer membrane protein